MDETQKKQHCDAIQYQYTITESVDSVYGDSTDKKISQNPKLTGLNNLAFISEWFL